MKKKIFSVLSLVLAFITVFSSFVIANAETVKVEAPVVTEISATCTSVTIEWEEYNDDDMKFLVYRSTTGKAGTWKKLTTTKSGARSYTDKTVAPGKTYYYTVKAYFVGKDGTTYLSDMSGKHKVTATLAKPEFSLAGNSGEGVLLKWDTRNDASGFIIYKSTTGKSGSWSRLKVVNSGKAGSYTDSKVEIGKTYYYAIKAIKSIGGKDYSSPSSKSYKIVIKDVEVPKNVKAIAKDEGIYFSCDKVLATKGYIIYRSETGKAKTWEKICTTTSNNTTTYLDKTADPNTVYYYTAKSYKILNGKTIASKAGPAVRVSEVTMPTVKFEPAEVTFKSPYEVVDLKIVTTDFKTSDKPVISVDGERVTDAQLKDVDLFKEAFEKAKFTINLVEEKDGVITLKLEREDIGEGKITVEHPRYDEIKAEIKVNCPETELDKSLKKIDENVETAEGLAENAIKILDDALKTTDNKDQVAKANELLTEAKNLLDSSVLLMRSYEDENKTFEEYKEDLKELEWCLDKVTLALKSITGDKIKTTDIERAIEELESIVED